MSARIDKPPSLTCVITIPGLPVSQARPRFARLPNGVRTYNTPEVTNYRALVQMCAAQAEGKPKKPWDCPLAMSIHVFVPRPKSRPKREQFPDRKPDLDNLAKLLCDALEGIIYTNDSRVITLLTQKSYDANPRVTVDIAPVEVTS